MAMAMLRTRKCCIAVATLLLLCCGLWGAAAMQPPTESSKVAEQKPLSTQHLHINQATVTVLPDSEVEGKSIRPGHTRVKVLVQQEAVSPVMSVTTARVRRGLTQNVVDAWRFLKNYALLHTRLADINKQSGDNSRPFPKPSLAHKAASLLYPTEADLLDYTARAEAFGDHRIWTHCSAPNVLLYPTTNGAGFGAVADVLNVEESPDSDGAITLTLDIVHEPKIVNELEGHPKQTMDERSHYHWLAPQGIDVDANKMLSLVSSSGGMLQGLSVFMKGGPTESCDGKPLNHLCEPIRRLNGTCVKEYRCRDDDNDGQVNCEPIYAPRGTVCEHAKSHCQPARVCTGDSDVCPKTVTPNGAKCPYTDADHNPIFFPFATKDGSDNTAALMREEPYDGFPECFGKCFAGQCTMDKTKYGGCCYLSDRKFDDYHRYEPYSPYASAEGKAGTPTYDSYDKNRDNLICWEREEPTYYPPAPSANKGGKQL